MAPKKVFHDPLGGHGPQVGNHCSSESNTPAHTEQAIPSRPLSSLDHDDMDRDEHQDLDYYLSLLTKFLWKQFLVKL